MRGSCCASAPRCPGPGIQIRSVNMDFRYGSSFAVDSPDAYETLLLDCMIGDAPPLHPRRRGGARLGDPGSDPGGLGLRRGRSAALLRRRQRGGRRPPTSCSSATDGPGDGRDETHGRPAAEAERELAVHRRLMRFGEAESTVAPSHGSSADTTRAPRSRPTWPAVDHGRPRTAPRVTEKGLPHARASVLNLIVIVPDEPSADTRGGAPCSAWASATRRAPSCCWPIPKARARPLDASSQRPLPRRPEGAEQVCYEEVVLTVRGEAAAHLNGIVAPLLIHDLPTLVWWPGDPPFADPIFDQLVEMGDRLIIDSDDFSDLLVGFRRLTNLRRRSGVGDLTWKRLGWWQELTAQFFDAPRFRRYLPNLNRLLISYALPPAGGRGPPRIRSIRRPGRRSPIAQAILYASWIASRLDWKRYSTDRAAGGWPAARSRSRVATRWSSCRSRACPDRRRPARRAALGAAARPRRDGGGRIHHRSGRGRGDRRLERGRHDRPAAPRADGAAIGERAAGSSSLMTDRHDDVYEAAVRAAAIFLAAARPAEEAG